MAHLAFQIHGESPQSAKNQIIDARIAGGETALMVAVERDESLREKFMRIARPFFDEHVILGSYANDGQSRDIIDVLYDERNRERANLNLA